jgi:hypothetical protein
MLPWSEDPRLNLREHAANYLAYALAEVGGSISLGQVEDGFFPKDRVPGEYWVDEDARSMTLEVGENRQFNLNLQVREPARFAYAIRVEDIENSDSYVISDIIEVEAIP